MYAARPCMQLALNFIGNLFCIVKGDPPEAASCQTVLLGRCFAGWLSKALRMPQPHSQPTKL